MISRIVFSILISLFITACNDSKPAQTEETTEAPKKFIPPVPGTLIAKASMPIHDGLNDFDFKVRIEANEHTSKGTYTIFVSYGPNENSSMFTLPRGGEDLPVSIKQGTEYTYIIGFTYQGKFYDYYEVSFQPGHPPSTSVKNIKAWVLQ